MENFLPELGLNPMEHGRSRSRNETLFVRVNLEKVQGGLSELLCFPSRPGMFCIDSMDVTPGGLTPDMSVELRGNA